MCHPITERMLSQPWLFNLFNRLVGIQRFRSIVTDEYIRSGRGDSILDIGCGTSDVLAYLPEIRYVGIDSNPRYIKAAQRRFGSRGQFLCGDLTNENSWAPASFDI